MGSSKRLVWIVCRGRCGGDQPARLAKEEGPHLQLGSPDGPLHGYVAYCLNCGYRATDHGPRQLATVRFGRGLLKLRCGRFLVVCRG